MNVHQQMRERLAAYEQGLLEGDERRAFEAHALECDECFAELSRGSAATDALRGKGTALLEAVTEKPARPPLWPALRLTLPLAAAVAFAAVLLLRPRTPDLRELATFPHEGPTSALTRAGSLEDGTRELLEAGVSYLELGEHDQAEERFRAAMERDPSALEAAYLFGLSRALRGDAESAIEPLEAAAAGAPEELHSRWTWVLANAYLKAGRLDEARAVLEENVSEGGDHSGEAHDLLVQISPGQLL
ncbi:MAG: tetratricopeptide repeat protein [Candidatus Eiseniibacteriota bacterium]